MHERVYVGKSSRIYTATDRQSGTPIALKLYRKAKLTVLSTYQAKREARLHLQLSHPNIIQLYGAFEDENNHYLVQVRAWAGWTGWTLHGLGAWAHGLGAWAPL